MTYIGEGRSKKQAKLVAAKNALSTFLEQQQQLQQQQQGQFATMAPFPTIEFNRGAVVDVDFTSDDPADANFIIDTMNRIQTAQIPISGSGGGPLSALPGNGHANTNNNNSNGAMKPPPHLMSSSKSGMNDDAMTKEDEAFVRIVSTGGAAADQANSTPICYEKSAKVFVDKENHNDSGHVEPEDEDVEDMQEGLEYEFGSAVVIKEECRSEMDSDNESEAEEDLQESSTSEILEIIRMSVEHYIDYEEEIQSKCIISVIAFIRSVPACVVLSPRFLFFIDLLIHIVTWLILIYR